MKHEAIDTSTLGGKIQAIGAVMVMVGLLCFAAFALMVVLSLIGIL